MRAAQQGVALTGENYAKLSIDLMKEDFNARKNFAGSALGQDLPYNVVQYFHASVFGQFGISADAWTPNIALNLLETPEAKQR